MIAMVVKEANNQGESLFIEWPDGSSEVVLPSRQYYSNTMDPGATTAIMMLHMLSGNKLS